MSADGTPPEEEVAVARRARALGAAFFAWGVGGLLTAQAGELRWLTKGLPCALCGKGWCLHRALGHLGLHLAGLALLWVAWARFASRQPARPWRAYAAAGAPALLLLATLVEWADVETVLGSGPLLGLVGGLLVHPAESRRVRAAGWVLLLTALAGYYVVLVLDLGPHAARLPLRAVGAGGLLASLAVLPVTARWPGPVSSSS